MKDCISRPSMNRRFETRSIWSTKKRRILMSSPLFRYQVRYSLKTQLQKLPYSENRQRQAGRPGHLASSFGPHQSGPGAHQNGPVKFTFRLHPLQNALRGRLGFEVNFTGWGNPCQKCLRGRSGGLVKFTFRDDPLQKAFWGRLLFEVERLCVHLGASPPLHVPQRHIAS